MINHGSNNYEYLKIFLINLRIHGYLGLKFCFLFQIKRTASCLSFYFYFLRPEDASSISQESNN